MTNDTRKRPEARTLSRWASISLAKQAKANVAPSYAEQRPAVRKR